MKQIRIFLLLAVLNRIEMPGGVAEVTQQLMELSFMISTADFVSPALKWS